METVIEKTIDTLQEKTNSTTSSLLNSKHTKESSNCTISSQLVVSPSTAKLYGDTRMSDVELILLLQEQDPIGGGGVEFVRQCESNGTNHHTNNTSTTTTTTSTTEIKRYRCHRAILANDSDYFQNMFTSSWRENRNKKVEILIENHMSDCLLYLDDFIKFFYSHSITLQIDNVWMFYKLADYFLVDDLRKACHSFIKRQLTAYRPPTVSVTDVGQIIENFKSLELTESAASHLIQRIGGAGEEVDDDDVKEAISNLTVDVMTIVLTSQNNGGKMQPELVLFQFTCKWLLFSPDDRLIHTDRLLSCIRYGLMNVDDLARYVMNEPLITTSPNLRYQVMVALSYAASRHRAKENHQFPEFRGYMFTKRNTNTIITTSSSNNTVQQALADKDEKSNEKEK